MILNAVNEYWASLEARYRASPLPAFLTWWGRELGGMVPDSLSARMVPPRPALWLLAEPGGASFTVWKGGEQAEFCDRFGDDEDAQILRDRWFELLAGFEEGQPEIRLCLPPELVLECPVELPLAVEANLATAIGYQLDQFTPFKASQVLHDFRIKDRDAQHGRIQVELRLAPLAHLEAIRERLARIGIRPHVIDTASFEQELPVCGGFNLLPEAERPRYVYARARLNWILAGVAVLVLGLVMAQSLYLRGQTVQRLQAEVTSLRNEAESVLALQQELEDSLIAANFLAERRRRQPVIIQVLDEVSRVLPNDMWVQQLQVRDNEVQMTGLADGSQRLIELLNDSPLLDDAEFRGSINVDPATGQERFNVRATIIRRGMQHAVAAGPGE
jgi:general secretion pathway protein L